MSGWKVGDKVETIPGHTEAWEVEAEWANKLSKPRTGTVVEVPLFCRTEGHGTILIEWDSLTDDTTWQRWSMTEAVRKVA